jgi:hypothetical protein
MLIWSKEPAPWLAHLPRKWAAALLRTLEEQAQAQRLEALAPVLVDYLRVLRLAKRERRRARGDWMQWAAREAVHWARAELPAGPLRERA